MADFAEPGVVTGITVAPTTQTTFPTTHIIDFTLPAQKVKDIPTSTMATVGGETFLAGLLKENGELKIKVQQKVSLNPATFLGVSDTWTITFPLSGAGTVKATAVFTGYLKEFIPGSQAIDSVFEAEAVIKVSGNIAYTAQT